MNEYDVDHRDILPGEGHIRTGKRLTKFNCVACHTPLTESELSDIRMAKAPCRHYNCHEKD
jgi:mono/diheme cytochrome c family protein